LTRKSCIKPFLNNYLIMKNLFTKSVAWALFIILPVLGLLYCEAPRNNPLDPGNPRTSVARIKGKVLSAQIPTNPVHRAVVYWDIDQVYTYTNANGDFVLNNITPQNGTLRFEKTSFITETFKISWSGASNSKTVSVNLNAAPQLDSLEIYTVVKNRQGDIVPQTELMIRALVSDPDNDIDTVYIKNDNLNIYQALKYNPGDRYYQEKFTYTDFPSLQKIIGHQFNLFVKDRSSHTIPVGSDKAVRIITDNFSLVYPASYQTVSPQLELKWNKFDPGYNFTWAVEIYVDDIPATVVWNKNNIAATDTSCIVDALLSENDYFWMVWCIDEFQNRARSKPVSFTIKE